MVTTFSPTIRTLIIYAGLPIFISGTFGNLLNIFCLWPIRKHPCALIFLALSFINCFVLFYGLLMRILSAGFDIDLGTINVAWCKTRIAFTAAFSFISLSFSCLASIDRLLVSCRQANIRQLSRTRTTFWSIIIVAAFWLCHSVPYLIYSNIVFNPISRSNICTFTSSNGFTFYQTYITFPLYLVILPNSILIITGLITFYNTTKLHVSQQQRRIQKQLTSMMLIQTPIIVLATLAFGIYAEYILFTSHIVKSAYRLDIENTMMNVVTLTLYIAFACQFYVFYFSSPSFRKATKRFLLCQKRNFVRENQVGHVLTSFCRRGNLINNNSRRGIF